MRRKGEIVFKDGGAKRGQCSKFVPKLLEVTGYGAIIVLSAEAYSLITVHMLFFLQKQYTVEKRKLNSQKQQIPQSFSQVSH